MGRNDKQGNGGKAREGMAGKGMVERHREERQAREQRKGMGRNDRQWNGGWKVRQEKESTVINYSGGDINDRTEDPNLNFTPCPV